MPKKYATTTTLVIVESPAKCKKIEQYLGPGYKVMASYGHLRELSSLKHIDFENNFRPTFTIIDNDMKRTQIEKLKKEINSAGEVILASDDDREGEAISWHICDMFKLNVEKTKRITFNEITESALKHAIQNPRTINMNIVHAQQTRQILDLLVGFKITAMLWKCITQKSEHSLSAGRCQTPALKIIYDNQKEINESKMGGEKKVYNTIGYFTNSNIAFDLNKQFETEDSVTDFLEGSIEFRHIYTCSQPVKVIKPPPMPFTTSRLQQTASNELRYSPKETMRLCQKLYEAGHITYMRTDSKTYCKEFIETAKEYILRNFPAEDTYINENIHLLVSRDSTDDKSVKKNGKKDVITPQEAHEAIRPTNISLKELPLELDSKERRMYKLIWANTLESCMSPAIFYSITATISACNNNKFSCTSELINFPGWQAVAQKPAADNKIYHYLQIIKQNDMIPFKKMNSKVTIKNIKHHYTEARLVQLLEEKGIGRPSTFSMLVDKIQERGYVKKEDVTGVQIMCNDFELVDKEIYEIETKREFGNEKGKLVIQSLGIIVMEFLGKHFLDIFNYDYTKNMEDDLDKISKGEKQMDDLCNTCNTQLDKLIDNLKTETKLELSIDENNTYIIGKYGPVIKCSEYIYNKEVISFKSVKKDVDIHKLENGEYTLNEIVDTHVKSKPQGILGQYEGNDVILKKGKFGLYITWGENSKTLKELGNRPIENVTFDEVKKYLEAGPNIIREITPSLSIRKGAKGDYIFYKTTNMKKPQFFDVKGFYNESKEDYKICNNNILKAWIKEKYEI
jgi:DNA topoisomerase-1